MLLRLGIASKIYQNRRGEMTRELPDGKGGTQEYLTRVQHELVIANDNLRYFYERVGFSDTDKAHRLAQALEAYKREMNRERFVVTIAEIAADGAENVYDIHIPGIHAFDANGLVVHNCGEQILLPWESCNLGSINLSKMLKREDGQFGIDWDKLERTVKRAVHFMDNVITVNKFPLPQIKEATLKTRKIGLGVMGFADMLIRMGILYASEEAVQVAEEIMRFVLEKGREASRELAERRGPFPAFKGSIYDQPGAKPLRNATVITIAPTGTISIIADCSSGVEPNFAWKTTRRDSLGEAELLHPLYREWIEQHPGEKLPDYFITAHQVSPEWHTRIQAAFQKYTDNAVSKTVNFHNKATVEDVRNVYKLAYQLGCKGVTIYRDRSRSVQVLSVSEAKEKDQKKAVQPAEPGGKKKEEAKRHGRKEPRPRPFITTGKTIKMKTGCGNLYVTINEDEVGLCEVFSTMGKAGGCTASQSEAISRLISLALRSGISVDAILDDLIGISCPLPVWQSGEHILSCADAIGKAIRAYVGMKEGRSGEVAPASGDEEEVPGRRSGGTCPECGGVTEFVEGCVVCRACGFSRCE